MKILVRDVQVLDPESPVNGKVRDLYIEDGVIRKISSGATAAKGVEVFNGKGSYISPGWFDLRSSLKDPGFEFKEDLQTGAEAAAFGGYTAIACLPDTQPVIQSKAEVQYIKNKSRAFLVDIFPLGAITSGREGRDITEMYDMQQAGAVAFSDGNRAMENSSVLMRALLYAKGFNGTIFSHAEDKDLAPKWQMHEGIQSTMLGMKGLPSIAEEIMVNRDIELVRYTGGRLHFSHISTVRSVELIKKAKKDGLDITCDVSVNNLVMQDDRLEGFDSNYKVKPPLRSQKDSDALIKGLLDGTIDAIVSDHFPEDTESKRTEFEYSSFGIIGLQTCFSLLNTFAGKIDLETIISCISAGPRKILQLPPLRIKEGEKANFTIFSTKEEWTYSAGNNKSRSRNSPFLGTKLKGRAMAVMNNGQFKVLSI